MVKTRKTRRKRNAGRHRTRKGGFLGFSRKTKNTTNTKNIFPFFKKDIIIENLNDIEQQRYFKLLDELEDLDEEEKDKINELNNEIEKLTLKSLKESKNKYISIFTKCKKSTINKALKRGDCYILNKEYNPEFQLIGNNNRILKEKIIADIMTYVEYEYNTIPYYEGRDIERLIKIYRNIVDFILNQYYIGTSETKQTINKIPYEKEKSFVYYPAKTYINESNIQYFCFVVYDVISIAKGENISNLWYRNGDNKNVPFIETDLLSKGKSLISSVDTLNQKCKEDLIKCYYNFLYSKYNPEKNKTQQIETKHFIDKPYGSSDKYETNDFYVEEKVPTISSYISDLDETNPYRDTEYDTKIELKPEPELETKLEPEQEPELKPELETKLETVQTNNEYSTEDLLKYINDLKAETKKNKKIGKPCVDGRYTKIYVNEKNKCIDPNTPWMTRNFGSTCRAIKTIELCPTNGGTYRERISNSSRKTNIRNKSKRRYH